MIFREKKTYTFFLEIGTCDSLNYTMDHSKYIALIQMEEFISAFRILLIAIVNMDFFYLAVNINWK